MPLLLAYIYVSFIPLISLASILLLFLFMYTSLAFLIPIFFFHYNLACILPLILIYICIIFTSRIPIIFTLQSGLCIVSLLCIHTLYFSYDHFLLSLQPVFYITSLAYLYIFPSPLLSPFPSLFTASLVYR